MNTTNPTSAVALSLTRPASPDVSTEAREMVEFGRAHFWPFQILGRAPMLEAPLRLGDWLLLPAQQDSTVIPTRAMNRIRAIFNAGIRPKGFVVVHEAPMLLRAPVQAAPGPDVRPPSAAFGVTGGAAGGLLGALGSVLTAFVSTILPAFFIVAAAMVDPILVAVTEDDYWIEIDRWKTE